MSELYWLDSKCDLYVGTGDIVGLVTFVVKVTSAPFEPEYYMLSEIVVFCPFHDDSLAYAPFALVVGIGPLDLIAGLVTINGDCLRCPDCECAGVDCHSMPAFRWLDLIQHTIGHLV